MQDEFYLGWKIMLCSSDVESIVISYLEPHCLASFFIECGLNFSKKFVYDARGCILKCKEVNKIFGVFSGVILIGLSFYDEECEIIVPLDKILYCDVMKRYDKYCPISRQLDKYCPISRQLDKYCPISRQLDKMSNMIELKLIDYHHEDQLGKWMSLRKLTIQRDKGSSSPFLGEILEYDKLNTLRLLNFEFCASDYNKMSQYENLVNLEIDGFTKFKMYEFRKLKWNISVLKLRHCDGTNLDILLSCPNVRYVKIVDWKELMDISALVKCVKLERVEIMRCPRLADVSVLRKCIKLRRVRVKDCAEKLNIMKNV